MPRSTHHLALCLLTLVAAGCGGAGKPLFDPPTQQTAQVGVELQVLVHSMVDLDEEPDYTMRADFDYGSRAVRPSLTPLDGAVLFRWTPLARDVGRHVFTVYAATANGRADFAIAVEVVGGAAEIHFTRPLGDGTTLDVTMPTNGQLPCADIAVQLEAASLHEVKLIPGAIWPTGAALIQDAPFSGLLRYCPPTPDDGMMISTTVVPLSMVATSDTMRVEKRYTIVLLKGAGQ